MALSYTNSAYSHSSSPADPDLTPDEDIFIILQGLPVIMGWRFFFESKIHRRRNIGGLPPASTSNGAPAATPTTSPCSNGSSSSATPLSGKEQRCEMTAQPPPSYSELFSHSHSDSQAVPPMDPLVVAARRLVLRRLSRSRGGARLEPEGRAAPQVPILLKVRC